MIFFEQVVEAKAMWEQSSLGSDLQNRLITWDNLGYVI